MATATTPETAAADLYATEMWARDMFSVVLEVFREEDDPSPELVAMTEERCEHLGLSEDQAALASRLSRQDLPDREIWEICQLVVT